MRTKEQLEADIQTWDGKNKYIVKQAKEELKALEEKPVKKKSAKKNGLDLNGDGKVDKKDASIAGQVLRKIYKKRKK